MKHSIVILSPIKMMNLDSRWADLEMLKQGRGRSPTEWISLVVNGQPCVSNTKWWWCLVTNPNNFQHRIKQVPFQIRRISGFSLCLKLCFDIWYLMGFGFWDHPSNVFFIFCENGWEWIRLILKTDLYLKFVAFYRPFINWLKKKVELKLEQSNGSKSGRFFSYISYCEP